MAGRKRPRTDPEVANAQFGRDPDEAETQPTGANEKNRADNQRANKPDQSRSAHSIEEGGQNEQQGEPPPGYFTVAPGKQQGGKRSSS